MANRYWVGGTGTWDTTTTTHWAATSGGTGGVSVPASTDDVFFDANSGTGTVTMSGGAETIHSINFTGYTGTFNQVSQLSMGGDITLGATTTYSGGNTWSVRNDTNGATHSITSNGKSFWYLSLGDSNNNQGTYNLMDDVAVSQTLDVHYGTLNTNNHNITCLTLWAVNAGTKTLNLGSSTITVTDTNQTVGFELDSNTTLNAGTSLIKFTGSWSTLRLDVNTTFTFYDIQFTNVIQQYIDYTGGSPPTAGTWSCHNLTITGSNFTGQDLFFAIAPFTITGTFTVSGADSTTHRLRLWSGKDVRQHPTVTAAAATLTNVDVININATGAAYPFGGTSIGVGGWYSGIAYTTPVTRYWVGNAGNFSDTAHWSTSSGGAGGASMPLLQDTVVFDANSFTIATTLTLDIWDYPSLDFSNLTNLTTISSSHADGNLFGHLIGGAHTNWSVSGNWYLYGQGGFNLNTGSYSAFSGELIVYSTGNNTYTITGNSSITGNLVLRSGTLTATTQNVTVGGTMYVDDGNTLVRTLNMGSGTWTVWDWVANNSANLTFNCGTSTIVVGAGANTSDGYGSLTYYKVDLSGAASPMEIGGGNTFDTLILGPGKTYQFSANFTTTVRDLQATGTAGNLITLKSDSAGTPFTLKQTTGKAIVLDYVDLIDCHGYSNGTAGSYVASSTTFSMSTMDAGATSLTLGDDAGTTVTIPFSFTFNGVAYTQVSVGSNGYLSFDTTASSANGQYSSNPIAGYSGTCIAPMWTDLYPPAGGTIKYETFGSAGSRVFVVEWAGVADYNFQSAFNYTFQAKFFESDNHIEFHVQSAGTSSSQFAQGIGVGNSTSTGYNGRDAGITTTSDLTNDAVSFAYTAGAPNTLEYFAGSHSTDGGNNQYWSFTDPGGKVKAWNGTAWVLKPAKAWTGSQWYTGVMRRWNGTAWVRTHN